MTMIAERVFMCPTCGDRWYGDEITEDTVSGKRMYCQSCVGKLDTAERRAKWFDEQDGNFAKLAIFYLTNDTRAALEKSVDARALVAWARATDPDGFEDALFDYIYRGESRKLDYWAWLLANN